MAKRQIKYDCAVIGAGASGMMAAITVARSGKQVLLLEHTNKLGKKLLATGNGKCNFTNAYMDHGCFRGDKSLFSVMEQFTNKDTIAFFHDIGIYPKVKNGYYYPNSEQASSVVNAFEKEIRRLNIHIMLESELTSIEKVNDCFVLASNARLIYSKTLIFACGLLASPKLGSDGSCFSFIKQLGHHFTTMVPALCGFYAKGCDFKKVSGVRCDACVSIYIDKQQVASDTGELQLTEYGISGIPVFQVSRFASLGIANKKQVFASIRFLPALTEEEILQELSYRFGRFGEMTASELLEGFVNQKLISVLLEKANLSMHSYITSQNQIMSIVEVLLDFQIELTKPREYEFAQVCAGGLKTEDIDTTTLMSHVISGLFFCGELLDVDGICGGYNLQWAWSSGFVAGSNAAKYILEGFV